MAERVVGPLRDAGVTDIYVTGYRNALVVEFGLRPFAGQATADGYRTRAAVGAALMIALDDDGRVRAYRRPFYDEHAPMPHYAAFADFGSPEVVNENHISASVAEFLEWVGNGPGLGGLPIRTF